MNRVLERSGNPAEKRDFAQGCRERQGEIVLALRRKGAKKAKKVFLTQRLEYLCRSCQEDLLWWKQELPGWGSQGGPWEPAAIKLLVRTQARGRRGKYWLLLRDGQ